MRSSIKRTIATVLTLAMLFTVNSITTFAATDASEKPETTVCTENSQNEQDNLARANTYISKGGVFESLQGLGSFSLSSGTTVRCVYAVRGGGNVQIQFWNLATQTMKARTLTTDGAGHAISVYLPAGTWEVILRDMNGVGIQHAYSVTVRDEY